MKGWLSGPDPCACGLTAKEAVLFLQRLAQLDRVGAIPSALKSAWDTTLLDLLYALCTCVPGNPQCEQLKVDAYDKVERVFCLGLSSRDPATRKNFFQLYLARIPPSLYERLRYIICIQDWDHIANTFWLKHAVVRAAAACVSANLLP